MSKEAMKLALEALLYAATGNRRAEKIVPAINALETALTEQPTQSDPCPGCRKGGVCRTPQCGRLKLPVDHPFRAEQSAQQDDSVVFGVDRAPAQQEPVAWRNAAIRVGEDLCSVGPFGYYDMTAEQWLDWALSVVTVHAPPPAQRKPLTDEEIYDMYNEPRSDAEMLEFARAIEAAHGIKGDA